MAEVTVPEVEPFEEYTVGGTPQSTFTIPNTWAFFDQAADIRAFKDGTELTYAASPSDATEFSVTGIAFDNGFKGGQIDLGATVTNCTISLQRDVPISRTENFPINVSTLNIGALNTALSRIAAWAQQFNLRFMRAIRLADGDSDATLTLPVAASRASKYLGFDASGNVVATEGTADATPISSFMADVVAAATAAAARTLLGAGTGNLDNLVEDTTPQLGGALDTNSKIVKYSKGADVASANALTLGTDGNYFDITGTTAITSIATLGAGTHVKLHFDGALTLTHHATNLILPGGANITTAAGDEAEFVEYATGTWRCTSYAKADGTPIVSAGGWTWVDTGVASNSAAVAFTGFESKYDYLFMIEGVYPATDSQLLEAELGISGPTYRTANYDGTVIGITSAVQAPVSPTDAIAMHANGASNVSTEVGVFELLIINPAAATKTAWKVSGLHERSDSAFELGGGGGQHTTAEAMDAIRFRYSGGAGNIAAGNFYQYKRANA